MSENRELVVYATEKGEVSLSVNVVREMFCKEATDTEIKLFMNLCKFQGLNPFLKEVYLVKYGSNPASIVTGKETFTKRASRHPQFNGYDTGLELGEGGLPVSASATVYRKDREHPVRIEVDFDEYVSLNKEGQPVKNWREKPKTMIRKVALVQALREAFPEEMGGLYEAAEIEAAEIMDAKVEDIPPERPEGAGKPVQPGQPTPHAAPKPQPKSSGNGEGKRAIKDPDAPATAPQVKAVCATWADQAGYPFSELKGYLSNEDGTGIITKQQASDLIEMANEKNFNSKVWEETTGIQWNAPPQEG